MSGKAISTTGLPDSIQNGMAPAPLSSTMNGAHPLQNRLEKWNETQMDFKLETLRRTYGAGEPIRRAMEMEIVSNTMKVPEMLGPRSDIHREILENRDASIDWEDIYTGNQDRFADFHSELERQMGI